MGRDSSRAGARKQEPIGGGVQNEALPMSLIAIRFSYFLLGIGSAFYPDGGGTAAPAEE